MAPAKLGLLKPETRAHSLSAPSFSLLLPIHQQVLSIPSPQSISNLSIDCLLNGHHARSSHCPLLPGMQSALSLPAPLLHPPPMTHSLCKEARGSCPPKGKSCQTSGMLTEMDTFFSRNYSFGSRLGLSQIPSSGMFSIPSLGQLVGI